MDMGFTEFNSAVVLTPSFLKMTDGAKALYLILNLLANNMGVVQHGEEAISKANAKTEDLNTLVDCGFVLWRDTDEVIITDWFLNNRMPKRTEEANLLNLSLREDRRYYPLVGFTKHGNEKDTEFDRLWAAYPKRQNTSKKEARKAFNSVGVNVDVLIKAIETAKKTEQWKNVQYIPALAVWLNQRRWETEGEIDNGYPGKSGRSDTSGKSKWGNLYDVGGDE